MRNEKLRLVYFKKFDEGMTFEDAKEIMQMPESEFMMRVKSGVLNTSESLLIRMDSIQNLNKYYKEWVDLKSLDAKRKDTEDTIYRLLGDGLTQKEIMIETGYSRKTVNSYTKLWVKLGNVEPVKEVKTDNKEVEKIDEKPEKVKKAKKLSKKQLELERLKQERILMEEQRKLEEKEKELTRKRVEQLKKERELKELERGKVLRNTKANKIAVREVLNSFSNVGATNTSKKDDIQEVVSPVSIVKELKGIELEVTVDKSKVVVETTKVEAETPKVEKENHKATDYIKNTFDKDYKKFKRGDVVYVSNEAYDEMNGIIGKSRPAVIVQNDDGNYYSGNVIVCYVTSVLKKHSLPTHVYINDVECLRESMVLTEQIQTIDKKFITYMGKVAPKNMEDIEKAIVHSLGLEEHISKLVDAECRRRGKMQIDMIEYEMLKKYAEADGKVQSVVEEPKERAFEFDGMQVSELISEEFVYNLKGGITVTNRENNEDTLGSVNSSLSLDKVNKLINELEQIKKYLSLVK